MTIRQATLEDMPQVVKVHTECFPKDEHFTTLMGGNNLTQKMYEAYLRTEKFIFGRQKARTKLLAFVWGICMVQRQWIFFIKVMPKRFSKEHCCC